MTNKNKNLTTKCNDILDNIDLSDVKVKFEKGELKNQYNLKNSQDPKVHLKFVKLFGSTNSDIAAYLINKMPAIFANNINHEYINFITGFLEELKITNPMQALIVMQMLGTYTKFCHCIGKANLPTQNYEAETENINRATKLSRLFLNQVEALQKLQNKAGQKITVEHVNVNDGGKAIIGSNNIENQANIKNQQHDNLN